MNTRRTFVGALAACAVAASFALGAPSPSRAQSNPLSDYPNVFFSPSGQPFRAKPDAPYPVVDWFKQADKNGDGKIDHAEFIADATAFFKYLDINQDGIISSREVLYYEYKVAPEIVGVVVPVADLDLRRGGARLWLAQMGGGGGMGGAMGGGQIDPGGDATPSEPRQPKDIDESKNGASPFSFFDQPEPVTAADADFNGRITLKNFLRLADARFDRLDRKQQGYLTLADLPKTPVQKALEHRRKH
jgi:hypothetical protein